ncbi:hypothetical protein [Aquaspirillum sp. LM1]|uniref:hypothetical protein n=1 Tax=Aquaspirillum sp. LM1 TaxID=1938604 RepID=UPI001237693F|nr:hypothetical protein [Aquaspirillum sp. LM1]
MQKSDGIRVFEASRSDVPRIKELIRVENNEPSVSEHYLDWWYFQAPGCPPSLVVAEDASGQLVGVTTMRNFPLCYRGDAVQMAMPQKVLTAESVRGKGLFGRLYREAEAVNARQSVINFLAFPNLVARPIYLTKFDYIVGKSPDIWLIPLPGAVFRPSAKLHERFDSNVLQAYAGQKIENVFIKDAEYLHWRYEKNPPEKPVYKVPLYADRELVGYAILAVKFKKGIPLACLMDMFYRPGVEAQGFVHQVKQAAASIGAYALLVLEHPALVCFRDTWMTYTVKNKFNFIVKGQDAAWATDLSNRRFGFTFGDMDFI